MTILNSTPEQPDDIPTPAAEANTSDRTGTAVDGIESDPGMDDVTIQAALAAAMRGEDTGLDIEQDDNGWDGSAAEGSTPGQSTSTQEDPPPSGVDPAGEGEGEGAGVGSPIPGQGQTPPPSSTSDDIDPALAPIPPGMVQVPIEEYDPLTGQRTTRLHVIPADEVGGLLGWANSLTNEEREVIARTVEQMRSGIASGTTPISPYPAASGSGPNTPTPGSPVPGVGAGANSPSATYGQIDPATGLPIGVDPSDVDPALLTVIQAQQAQLQQVIQSQAQFQAAQEQFQQRQMVEDRARIQSEIDATASEYGTSMGLDDTQIQALKDAAAKTQHLPVAWQKHFGNARLATLETLEMTFWSDPAFRQLAIQNELATNAATNAATTQRKQKAASLSGGGGAVARVAPAAKPLTKVEREAAMVQELQHAMNNGQTN